MLEKFRKILFFAGNYENFLCWHSFVLDWTRIFGHCAGLDWTGFFEILGNTGVDQNMLQNLIKATHEQYMHLGQRRLRSILNLLFPNLHFSNDILQKICKQCPVCVKRQRLAAANTTDKMLLPNRPNQIIHIDHFTPFSDVRSVHNKVTILSIKDSFSKYVTLVPCRSYSHSEIVDILRFYVGTHGKPAIIKADNALTSQELERFCDVNNIKLAPTPVARPQANGQVERVHRELRRYIDDTLKALELPNNRWAEVIPTVMNLINSVPHTITGYSPESIQIGRYTADYTAPLSKEIKDKYVKIHRRLELQQNRYTKDSKGPYPNTLLKKGDKIFVHTNADKPVRATVLRDFGNVCLVRKTEPGRFRIVTVHKSLISLDLS